MLICDMAVRLHFPSCAPMTQSACSLQTRGQVCCGLDLAVKDSMGNYYGPDRKL